MIDGTRRRYWLAIISLGVYKLKKFLEKLKKSLKQVNEFLQELGAKNQGNTRREMKKSSLGKKNPVNWFTG